MDVTPLVPEGRQIIQSYGSSRFRVSDQLFEGSVLVWPEESRNWAATSMEDLSFDSLKPILDLERSVEVLLLGCGTSIAPIPKDLRSAVREFGVVMEPMDTGAACRTYNVLMSEERRVAAALIAVE